MDQRVPASDGDRLSLVAEVDEFEGEPSDVAAMDFCRVEEGESHAAVFALGG